MITFAPVPAKITNEPTTPVVAESAVPLKVTIVYEGVPAGRRAVSMIQRLVAQGGEPTHLVPHLWRFDLLQDASCRARAMADAVGSDLLILAADRVDALPPEVETWVSDFLARRRGTPVTILAMWGVEEEWTVSLLERNAAGRLQPIHAPDTRAASAGPRGGTRLENLVAA